MNELKNILKQNLNDNFISAVLSNPRDEKLASKVKVRPVLMKDTRVYQMETFRGNQAFHENLSADEACEKMLEAMENMKQMQLVTADAEFSVLISKKGKVTIKKKQKKAKMRPLDLNHNRKKQYILQEGVPVPFLQDLGVMTEEGKIVHARFDKFRQINRFLEFIDMEHTPKNILLRAVKTGRRADNEESIRACETFLRVTPTLGRLLDEKGEL